MTQEYRVFKRVRHHKYLHEPEDLYEVYEVFCDDSGAITSISNVPEVVARSLDELRSTIKCMYDSCDKPVLNKA